jgi:hypothetical protein
MKLVERSELKARRNQPVGLIDRPHLKQHDHVGLESQDRVKQDDRQDRMALKKFRVHLRRALA